MNKAHKTLVALLTMGVLMAVATTPALAARGHAFGQSFGGTGAGAGQFNDPTALAVNETTHDLYLVDSGNRRVERFTAAGAYIGQFNGSEAPSGEFIEPGPIAVDNSSGPSHGDVYVVPWAKAIAKTGVIDVFNESGTYLRQLTVKRVMHESPEQQKLKEANHEEIDTTPRISLEGIAVDDQGNVWVTDEQGSTFLGFDIFNGGEEKVEPTFEAFRISGGFPIGGIALAPDLSVIYVPGGGSTGEVLEFGGTSAEELHGTFETVDAERSMAEGIGIDGVATERGSGDIYVDNLTSVGRFDPERNEVERIGSGHLTKGSGVAVDKATGQVYVADAAANVVNEFPLEPPSAARVQGDTISDVTAESAQLEAEIGPSGASTTYHFEYGVCVTPSTCATSPYGTNVPAPDGFVGSDFEVHLVTAHPQDLLAHTVYHFRAVASSALSPAGGTEGPEVVFTTQAAGGSTGLPDGREWELVSPPDKHGGLILPIREEGLVQASATGGGIAYLTSAPPEAAPQGNSNIAQVLSTRGPQGWSSQDIASPHETATGLAVHAGQEYRAFSSDLSLGVLQPLGVFTASLSEQASEQTSYLRSDYTPGGATTPCTSSCYRPLVSGCPPAGEECSSLVEEDADVPDGTVFGDQLEGGLIYGPVFVGGNSDLSDIVVSSQSSLVANPAVKNGLYEWAAGKLSLVSVLPDGKPLISSTTRASLGGVIGGETSINPKDAVSEDGSRVVWAEGGGEKHLYLRDMTAEKTVQLDLPEAACFAAKMCGAGQAEPAFQLAAADDSRVFFTDDQKLTGESGEEAFGEENKGDLYECHIVAGPEGPACELTDLTPLNNGDRAGVLGLVPGASEDGTYVYFVANGVVAGSGASQGDCDGKHLTTERCNLYVRHEGSTRLVMTLSGADSPDWGGRGFGLPGLTGRTSPDGHWFTFMSQLAPKGYDNRDALSGVPDEEVYLYDYSGNGGAGSLVCASCNPTNARPHGMDFQHLATGEGGLVGGDRVWPNSAWIAANIPGSTPYSTLYALYQSRFLSDSGRLFFNSSDALVPQDTNGNEDVYEYEPLGVRNREGKPECTQASATFGERSGGCVGLISSGSSPEESAFLDASESGGDVFFLTSAKLSSEDFDSGIDLYDAHECTASSPCIPAAAAVPPPCTTGDSCKAAPTPQPSVFGAPSSATFSGAGNVASVPSPATVTKKVVKCAKGKALSHGKCTKRKNKSKAKSKTRAKKANRATSGRRGN